MGRSGLLPRGLIAVLLLLAACGGDDKLLVAMDISDIYAGGGGSGGYGPSGGGAPGKIVGKVRFEGTPWAPKRLDITTADGFCVAGHEPHGLMWEGFLMGADGALANVVVYVKEGASGAYDPPKEPLVLDQLKCQYIPHVAVIQVGQPLVVKSSDRILHNVHAVSPVFAGGEFNQSMPSPAELPAITFRRPQVGVRVFCDVHSWMESWLTILPHPFHDVTGGDGMFEIANVPPGKYRLAAWHEKLGEKAYQDVTVTAGGTATVEFVLTR